MAKKFFYNRVYNTKRTIINFVIIGVCIIGVIICFIITSSFEGESHSTSNSSVSIKSESTVEVNEKFSNEIFFSKIENVDIKDIEVKYPNDYDISNIGKYNITLVISGKSYQTILNVVDTSKPSLTLKNVEIEKNKTYKASDFVEECIDNSNKNCKIEFYSGAGAVDEDGNAIDYSKYTEEGPYQIKISATDDANNQTIKEATLKIGKSKNESGNGNTSTPIPVTCKYGDNSYDKDKYLLAVDITANKCAISLDLYKDADMLKDINKLLDTETTRIKKDVEALNLNGVLTLNRKITAVINNSGNGIVGYEVKMDVSLTKSDKTSTIAEYKIDANGKRVFITNPYNLAK